MSTPEPLIRPPLQRRSQESLERVLQAGFELLKEEGFEGFTLQTVSRRAGVSMGSIYCTIARRLTHGPRFESAREVNDDALVAELSRTIADYLL